MGVYRGVCGEKRARMWNEKAAAGYFGFTQKRRLPSFTAQALTSRAHSGPRICQGPRLHSLSNSLGYEKTNDCAQAKLAPSV